MVLVVKRIISLNSIKQLVFVVMKRCILFAVGTEFLLVFRASASKCVQDGSSLK